MNRGFLPSSIIVSSCSSVSKIFGTSTFLTMSFHLKTKNTERGRMMLSGLTEERYRDMAQAYEEQLKEKDQIIQSKEKELQKYKDFIKKSGLEFK